MHFLVHIQLVWRELLRQAGYVNSKSVAYNGIIKRWNLPEILQAQVSMHQLPHFACDWPNSGFFVAINSSRLLSMAKNSC